MTFARELTLAMALLLSLSLSAGGAWTIGRNFSAALDTAAADAAARHLRGRDAVGELLGGTGAILAVLLLMLFFRRMPRLERLTWVLVLGGGIGNFIDRARSGVVVDYLNFQFISFPVFNFADICVTVGVALLVLLLAADLWQEHKAAKAAPPHGDA